MTRLLVLPFLLAALLSPAAAAPAVPGLENGQSLNEAEAGRVLLRELRCAACHEGVRDTAMKAAPELRTAGQRLTLDYLQRYLAEPASAHPGTTMPDLLAGRTPEERREIGEAIAQYLVSITEEVPAPIETPTNASGEELFHGIGCVACHSPRDAEGKDLLPEGSVSLVHLPGKYRKGSLAAFLHEPLKVRPSGRMPDMKLSREEAAALAAYLEPEPAAVANPKPDPGKARAGEAFVRQLNCASCHELPGIAAAAPSRASAGGLDLEGGCLSKTPESVPDFQLSDTQRKAIRTALAAPGARPSPAEEIRLRLTQLNCIACHVRDDLGGVSPERDAYFHSTEEALGNESRIPPPLTLVGAKLRPEWLNKVLYEAESIRPYMRTRMPQYGEVALAGLPDDFAAVDKLEPIELPEPDRDTRPVVRNGAHLLLGDKGLNCITCHNYNGKESPGMKGLDLMTSYQRLQPAWFDRFLRNPGALRPGIIMPSYWPDGKAVQTDILEGDASRQIAALWYNFSLGRSARDPSGIRNEPSKLEVGDRARVYRGRSRVAGYRGIAVGFPEGISYAFDAQNGALAAIWKGEFVSVNWNGQAAGDFNPATRALQLARDVAFLQRADEEAAWPLRPIRTKENPVNPDPLYPRNHGYAFAGYSFDPAGIPTFRYRCGETAIEDRSEPVEAALRRTFRFTAPAGETLYFRALVGAITKDSASEFHTPEIGIRLPENCETILRPTGDGKGQELLLKLALPKGDSDFSLSYTPAN